MTRREARSCSCLGRRRHHEPAAFETLLYWILQAFGLRQSDQLINVSDVLPEQTVEDRVAFTGEIVAEPPHPIAALSDEQLFVGQVPLIVGNLSFSSHQGLSRSNDPVPGLMVLRMADPDAEIRVGPRSRGEPVQLLSRHLFQGL